MFIQLIFVYYVSCGFTTSLISSTCFVGYFIESLGFSIWKITSFMNRNILWVDCLSLLQLVLFLGFYLYGKSIEKAREFQKNIYFCFVDYAKAFDCVDHNKLENSLRDGNTRRRLPVSWEIYMQIKKQQLEPDME